ncbi:uncharacterized protein [Aegilops tauschii subsp. strangulata]|uniref:uncharacterized protein n=1 Tax=Aegilops tauschii subsp. strangulata TaxID=200361 RepID=UPI003CC8D05F
MDSPVSSLSDGSNLFVGPEPSTAVDVYDLNINERLPIYLDQSRSSYYVWKTYFNLVFREYYLAEHIDNSVDNAVMKGDPEWSAIEATLIRWFYLTISKDIFHTIIAEDDDACTVWNKINALFTDKKLQRLVFLQQEFFECHQDDSTIDDYCMRLKMPVDELHDIGVKVSGEFMLSTLTAGLNEDFGNAASNLTVLPQPTFQIIIAYLKLEEQRMQKVKKQCSTPSLPRILLVVDPRHRLPYHLCRVPRHRRASSLCPPRLLHPLTIAAE